MHNPMSSCIIYPAESHLDEFWAGAARNASADVNTVGSPPSATSSAGTPQDSPAQRPASGPTPSPSRSPLLDQQASPSQPSAGGASTADDESAMAGAGAVGVGPEVQSEANAVGPKELHAMLEASQVERDKLARLLTASQIAFGQVA